MMSRFMKVCSITIILALLVNLLPVQVLAADHKPMSAITEPVLMESLQAEQAASATIVAEIKENRTAYTKEFKLSNGLHMAVVYPEIVHYEENGQWKDIDNTLKATGSGSSAGYTTTAGAWKAVFPQQLSKSNQVQIEKDGYTVSFAMAGELRGVGLPVIDNAFSTASLQIGTEETLSLTAADMQTATAQIQTLDYSFAKEQAEYPEAVLDKLQSRLVYDNVYSNTRVVYDLNSYQLKESIVLDSYDPQVRGYRFTLDTGELIPVLNEDGSIDLLEPRTQEVIFQMPAPYMIDNAGEKNNDVAVSLVASGDVYTLTYLMPVSWLADSSRQWPVILDPVITALSDHSNILDQSVMINMTVPRDFGGLICGNSTYYGISRTFIQYVDIPNLSSADVIVDAQLSLLRFEGTSDVTTIEAHRVASTWHSSTITWENQPTYEPTIEDYARVGASGKYTWEITDAVRDWYSSANTGIMLKAPDSVENGASQSWQEFYSIDYDIYEPNIWPYLQIQFRNSNGLESYWEYTASSAGRAGTGYVNSYSGNLVWTRGDLGFGGNRMPVSISHIYNANDAQDNPFGLGNGWRTNYHQTVTLADTGNYYAWVDGDGTTHYFNPSTGNEYIDEDGLELTLTVTSSGYTIKDKYDNTSYFDSSGRLIKLENNQATKSSINISYSGDRISYITDGVGRKYNFTYSGELLSKISYVGSGSSEIASVSFTYSGNNLTRVTDKDGDYTSYAYDSSNLMTSATDVDGYKITYTYEGNPKRVASIEESDGSALGGKITVEYAHNQTKLTDHNGNVQLMQFNDWGNLISTQDGEGRAQHAQYSLNDSSESASGTLKANQMRLSSRMQNTVINLLSNNSFEFSSSWSSLSTAVTASASRDYAYIGEKSLKVVRSSAGTESGVKSPSISVPGGESVSFSAYVKTGAGEVWLALSKSGSIVAESEKLTSNSDWTRLEVNYTNTGSSTATVYAQLMTSAAGTTYMDCVQAELMPTSSRFNILENSDMEQLSSGFPYLWVKSSGCTSEDTVVSDLSQIAPKLESNVLKIVGDPTAEKYIYQNINTSGSAGDTYVLSGWASGNATPMTDENREFGLKFIFNYNDGSTENAEFTVYFNTDLPTEGTWQYAATAVVAAKAYNSFTVQAVYNYSANTVYFDGIQVFKEAFGSSYTYDNEGNVISVVSLQELEAQYEYVDNDLTQIIQNNQAIMTYDYDTHHNVTKATSIEGLVYEFTYDSYGNNTSVSIVNGSSRMTSTATYSSDGNILVSTKDPLDKETKYGYNTNTNVLEWTQYPEDSASSRTQYTYDSMYRLATASVNVSGGSPMSASYTYTDDQLTKLTTASTTYNFSYGAFSQISSVKVGTQALATYSYTNDRNRYLDTLTYGNNDSVEYSYDDLGRVILETYEDGDTVSYAYDNTGALATVTDSESGIKTSYYYDLTDRLAMYTEKGSGYNHVVQNKYDEKNRLTQRNEIAGTMSAAEFYYYDDDNRVTDIIQGSIEESYTYDAFGRTTQRKTQNGTSTVLTENLTYRTVSGSPTGQVASLSSVASGYNGSLSYTYDDNGNILSVSDGTYTTSYVYDTANQLLRENNQAAGKTWTWTYDGAGNIQNRKEYAYTTGTLGAVQQQVNYLYGNSNWGDLLTSYNGVQWDYDQVGNVTDDGTWSYTWQHGRELASMSDGSTTWSFTYNADGLRTGRSDGTTAYKYFYIDGKLSHMLIGSSYVHFAYDASGSPIWMRYNGSRYFYVTNLQGDVIAILDSAGTSVVQYTYDAWGKLLSTTGTLADTIGTINPLLYRGYIYDHDTGLYYLQSRYYNPTIGRFINADTFVSTGQGLIGNNMFAYCRNNPVSRIDVSGTSDVCVAHADDSNIFNDLGNPTGSSSGGTGVGSAIGAAFGAAGLLLSHASKSSHDKETLPKIKSGGSYTPPSPDSDDENDHHDTENKPTKKKSQSLPPKGEANSKQTLKNEDGTIKQLRQYDSNGNASYDIDYNHSDGDHSHVFPHVHIWVNGVRVKIPIDFWQFFQLLIEWF